MKTKEYQWLLSEKHGGVESEAFHNDLVRLERGEPIDYVIGFSKFLGCHIDLSFRPLIPRTETEYWVSQAFEKIKAEFPHTSVIRCLDVFSGSGCIGIATLSNIPDARVDFADINESALHQIKLNIAQNNIDETRTAVYFSDIFKGIPVGRKYDVIFANPPYIPFKNKGVLDISVVNYEPHNALFSDENGLEHIRKTITGAKNMLAPGGLLFVEFDDNQKDEISRLLSSLQISEHNFYKDQFDKWRWMTARYS